MFGGVTMSISKINQMIRHITLLLLIVLAYWGCDINEGCLNESKISDASICTEEAQPVCGCDGFTYGRLIKVQQSPLMQKKKVRKF